MFHDRFKKRDISHLIKVSIRLFMQKFEQSADFGIPAPLAGFVASDKKLTPFVTP